MNEFVLGDVLSVITGKLLSPSGMDGIYAILNYMTGETLFTHQLPRAMEACAPVLKSAFPALAEVNPQIKSKSELDEYLEKAIQIYGNSFLVPRLNKNEYEPMNPVEEMVVMKSAKH